LAGKIAQASDSAALAALVFSSDAGEKDHLSGMGDRYDL
jgi:hypothetical protein